MFLNLPRACSSCSICYTVPFHLAAHLTWLSRWVKAKLHQSPVLVWSSNKLLLVPQIVFQAWYKAALQSNQTNSPWLAIPFLEKPLPVVLSLQQTQRRNLMRHLRIFMLMSSSPSSTPHCWCFICLCTKSVISLVRSPSFTISCYPGKTRYNKEVEWKEKKKDFSPTLRDVSV